MGKIPIFCPKYCQKVANMPVNLINFQTHNPTGEFLDDLYSHMLFPLITRPSRITSHTATLIDNIFCNLLDGHLVNGLLFTDISDYLPVFAINFTSTVSKVPSVHKVTIRDNSEKNLSNFIDQLKAIDWSFLEESSDPNSSYNSFLKYSPIHTISVVR